MSETNEIVKNEQPSGMMDVAANLPAGYLARSERVMADEKLDRYFMEKSALMCKSNIMPPLFRGDQFACYSLLQMAWVWELNPVLLAPCLYKVALDAPLSMDGKLVRTLIDKFAPIRNHIIRDEYFGDWDKILGKFRILESRTNKDKYGNPSKYRVPDWSQEDEKGLGIRLTATLTSGQEVSYELKMTQCLTRNSTLWAEDPQLQIFYRAIARFSRKYFPGVLNGMYIKEELQDQSEIITVTAVADAEAEEKADSKKTGKTEKMKEKLGVKPSSSTETAEKTEVKKPVDGEKREEKKESSVKLSEYVRSVIDESRAPVTLEDVKRFLSESKMLKTDMDDPTFPETWTKYISNNCPTLLNLVFEWMEAAENDGK